MRSHRRRCHRDRGTTAITVAIAAGIVLIIVVQLVNMIVFQWGQGVVRAALDEGARAGARTGDLTICEQRANDTVHDLAAGMADGVTISCAITGQTITATATISWDGWVTGIADDNRTLNASAALENR